MQNPRLFLFCISLLVLSSCSVQKQVSRSANKLVLHQAALEKAHIGIALYDATEGKYIYDHQSDKYFLPASNTKIFTLYAAMRYLGDSIPGLLYTYDANNSKKVWIQPTGDPSFLHPDFKQQPVSDFLLSDTTRTYHWVDPNFATSAWGNGWAWNDQLQDYMPERSAFPVNGNVLRLKYEQGRLWYSPANMQFKAGQNLKGNGLDLSSDRYTFNREEATNTVVFEPMSANTTNGFSKKDIPFITHPAFVREAIQATLPGVKLQYEGVGVNKGLLPSGNIQRIYSQHTDSLLRPMMYRSDNFFAEQLLLMIGQQRWGVMQERKLIDTLLATDLKDLPQRPNWVDGSGLSRYNLFTPRSIVAVLDKLRQEFAWERITNIFPTGGTGTISSYYQHLSGKIFAKTGSLSGQIALSGYLITRKQHMVLFSVLVNNHQTSAATVRKAVESFLTKIYERY